ncbi:MAG: serine hydrolase domain-containing protein [Terrimicrobiaceae bacterium]|nr:serine hydrolase domain-containing protein [Terrimicrobiaceae bacterium]
MKILGALALAGLAIQGVAGAAPPDIDGIVDTYAGNVFRRGQATALVVGITLNGQTFYRAYGSRVFGSQSPADAVDEHSIFEIGSVTKVWTTALAGQAVATGGFTSQPITLYTPLRAIGALPDLQPAMQVATIGDLASFTAGLPDVGSTGGKGERPPIAEWGVQDFVTAISALVPMNYNQRRPSATSLPAPYFYSDWSTGILGLLVTNDLSSPLPADAVDRWWQSVDQNIVSPLGMQDTYLSDPDSAKAARTVSGYEQPTAEAVVNAGRLVAVDLKTPGGRYADGEVPSVTITQSGATGAAAEAIMQGNAPNRQVRAIRVTNKGTGFRAPPTVVFGGPGGGASGQAIVVGGEVVGVQMTSAGRGFRSAPNVFFRGGSGTGASGTGIVSNGGVVGVVMNSGGAGYAPAPTVVISPGASAVNTVPVWAAAGALKSSASDLVKLCQVYLGEAVVAGNPVPAGLSAGARAAIQPLIQNDPDNPWVFSGMTWQVSTRSIQGGLNLTVSKDGSLPGFATYVTLVPAINLGVVILRSNNQTNTGEYADPIGGVAEAIATAIQVELMPE